MIKRLVGVTLVMVGCSGASPETGPVEDASTIGDTSSDSPAPDGAPSEAAPTTCAVDADCATVLASVTPSPSGCAEAFCDKASGKCGLRAIDKDGDGYRTAKCDVPGFAGFLKGNDCDDDDKEFYPGKARNCSATSDGTPITFPGGAPKGTCKYGSESCSAEGVTGKCEGAVAPAKEPNCASDLDSTCVGTADSALCGCKLGATKECYTGAVGTAGVGPCKKGTATCINSTSQAGKTVWGACEGQVVPAAADTCTKVGNDETCNGIANEKCDCIQGATRKCGTCSDGTQTCGSTGVYGSCVGARTDVGSSCNVCGGKIQCNGSCSPGLPTGYGGACGSCGGTVKCDGTCSVATPWNYNTACGSCGGKVKCDGTCSVFTPSDYGSTCSNCGGTVTCGSTCSKPGIPYTPGSVRSYGTYYDNFACCWIDETRVYGGACDTYHQFASCTITSKSGGGTVYVESTGSGSSCTCTVRRRNVGTDGATYTVQINQRAVCP